MNRRFFISSGVALAGAAMAAPVKRPNILFIFSDDQCWNALGCLGSEVKTPNLDRMVEQGTLFNNAYNMGAWQGAVCMASRTMLMTGKSLWNAHAYDQDKTRNPSDFWSDRFKRSGYKTYFAGKWHVSNIKPPQIYDVTGTVRPGMPDYFDPAMGGRYPWNKRFAGYFRPEAPGKDNWDPSDPKFGGFWEGGKHWSEVLGDESIGFLKDAAKSELPFFMQLAFNAPHDPRQSPKKYVELYPLDSVEVPKNFLPENPYADAMQSGKGLRDEDLAPFPRTEFAIKTHRQEYYAIITHMDHEIGRILHTLEKTGQRENTIIVFTSDHGLACGQHGLVGKQNMFEHSMKPPLIFCGKGIPQGKTIDAPVYMQDLMPTTLELAGVKIPSAVEFKSLVPVIQGSEKEPYSAIYGAYKMAQRMVRMGDMKLIWYPDADKYLLFDVKKDPLEMNDLSSNSEQAGTLKRLKAELKRQQRKFNDPMLVSQ
ncbi:sulfatase-like hydrolase/transferase [Pontiella sulfatireligans]|uniref:Arylsulfatase n=1 Tax=Pontiella sulfatireligans TaxID=2750658 RepID=A0A6C2UVE2_9BACT|nr:sulfatase-like hydrolase/transferase [Pontiella sulfatireligans]SPS74546.1 sulfatase S1_28 [Kiritimatiellales bacterium]VGO23144.1 Arylsulfatase [Pontiella sulfatireligans]